MAARVAAVGEISEDLYLPDGRALLGGISVNFARAARHEGAEVALFAPLGDDARGSRLRDELERAGLHRHVRTLSGATALQRIEVRDGERRFAGFEPGVLSDYALDPDELAALAAFDAVAVPCSPESARVFRQLAAMPWAPQKLVADFSQDSEDGSPAAWIAPWAARLAIAFVGGAPAHLPELRALAATIAAPIVLTVGAGGAHALRGAEIWHEPSHATHLVDTTGCGDAFQAAFTVSWLAGDSPAASLRHGAALAAQVAARLGADPEATGSSRASFSSE